MVRVPFPALSAFLAIAAVAHGQAGALVWRYTFARPGEGRCPILVFGIGRAVYEED